jgi:hypothetical protein
MLLSEVPQTIRNNILALLKKEHITDDLLYCYDTLDIADDIMMYLDTHDILILGEEHVSRSVWFSKKERSLIDACKAGNIIGMYYWYVLLVCIIGMHYYADKGDKLRAGDMDMLLLHSVYNNYLDVFKYLVIHGADPHAGGSLVVDFIYNNKKSDFYECLSRCTAIRFSL